jgi:hypothetical protein
MRWDDSSTISSVEVKQSSLSGSRKTGKGSSPISRSIRWSETNEIHKIHHIDDMSDEQIAATWYAAKEYSEIKSAYQLTIFMMEAGENITGDEHTSRGLEYRTQEGAWARYENKRDAYNAVLDEQDRQWKVDKDDHEKIRQIYLKHSTKCANAAVVRALQDERDIKQYLSEEKDKKKKKKIIIVKKKKKVDTTAANADGSSEQYAATTTTTTSKNSTTVTGKKNAKALKAQLEQRLAGDGNCSTFSSQQQNKGETTTTTTKPTSPARTGSFTLKARSSIVRQKSTPVSTFSLLPKERSSAVRQKSVLTRADTAATDLQKEKRKLLQKCNTI